MTRHKTPADSKDKMKRLSYVRRTVSQSIRSAVPRHRSPLQASLRARQGKEMAAKQGCVTREGDSGQAGLCLLTVEPLLVHDGAAAQGLIVLLVAHERVHAQDSCGDKGTSMTLLLWFETSWGPIFHMPGALLTETVRNMYTKCKTVGYFHPSFQSRDSWTPNLPRPLFGCGHRFPDLLEVQMSTPNQHNPTE